MKYLFPFTQIKQYTRIVLYGASDVGYDYYRQIMSSGYAEMVAWVDRNYEMYRLLDLPVDSPDRMAFLDYDAVVIAILDKDTILKVRDLLLNQGVSTQKIIWAEAPEIGYDIARTYSAEHMKEDAVAAELMKAASMVDEERLDVIVRYLYALEILQGETAGKGEMLYERMFGAMNGATEPTDHFLFRYFSDYEEKKGIESFKASFRRLLDSMKKEGFHRDEFIPLNRHGRMINGSHRCAAALALGIPVWVRRYPVDGVRIIDHHFGKDWFQKTGFQQEEVGLLLESLEEIKEHVI